MCENILNYLSDFYMKTRFLVLLALLLGGCNERLYHEGIENSSWPNADNPNYTVSIGKDSQVYLINHKTGQKEELPFFTRKLSHPITDRIRFSKDGKFLLIPVWTDNPFLENSNYSLSIWDIENHVLFKKVSISGKLIGQ
jgi:hypothetical protein